MLLTYNNKWTDSHIEYLKENYADKSAYEIASVLGRTKSSVYTMAAALNLKKSDKFLSNMAKKLTSSEKSINCRFKPGHVPFNAGCKGITAKDLAKIENMKRTQFKPGHVPMNIKPIGSERINKYGYTRVKVDKNKWRLKQRVIWEQHYGEIPPNTNIQFLDGNRRNFDISNLYSITRNEQITTQNGLYSGRYDEDTRQMITCKSAITRRINKLEKQLKTK